MKLYLYVQGLMTQLKDNKDYAVTVRESSLPVNFSAVNSQEIGVFGIRRT